MKLKLKDFIVSYMLHREVPSMFVRLNDDQYGVSKSTTFVQDGRRVNEVTASQESGFYPWRHKRKLRVQAWKADWNETSPMTPLMYEQFVRLFHAQEQVFIQFDAEMTRCWGRCVSVGYDIRDVNQDQPFFTPTWPIVPYGHVPGSVFDWTGALIIGDELQTSGYTVDPQHGIVVVTADGVRKFSDRTKVFLKYSWRSWVRIAAMDVQPMQIAQGHYVGTVVFEQQLVPDATDYETYMNAHCAWVENLADYPGSCPTTNVLGPLFGYGEAFGVLGMDAQDVNGYAKNKQKTGTAVGVLNVKGEVAGVKSSITKQGSTGIAPISVVAVNASATSVAIGIEALDLGYTNTVNWQSNINSGGGTGGERLTQALTDGNLETYIYGSTFPQEFSIGGVFAPLVHTGHSVSVKWGRLTSAASTKLTVKIMQESRVIHSEQLTVTDGNLVTSTVTISTTEAARITDYSKLKIQFVADRTAKIVELAISIPVAGGIAYKTGTIMGTLAVTAQVSPLRGYVEAVAFGQIVVATAASNGVGARRTTEVTEVVAAE